MRGAPKPVPHHRALHHTMEDTFTSNCLTVLSVIQGVALADLASVVVGGYKQYTVTHWLLVAITFATMILMWDAYMQQSILWEWVPDIRDAAIPFAFGAAELALNNTISLSLSGWLLAYALVAGVAALANWHAVRQARKEDENAEMLSLLGSPHRGLTLHLSWSLLLLGFSVVSRVGSLEASESIRGARGALSLALVVLVAAGTVALGTLSMRSWSGIVTYARTGRPPGTEMTTS